MSASLSVWILAIHDIPAAAGIDSQVNYSALSALCSAYAHKKLFFRLKNLQFLLLTLLTVKSETKGAHSHAHAAPLPRHISTRAERK